MKKLLVFAFCLLGGYTLYAQEINLSDFKLPHYERNELEINFNSNNSNYHQQYRQEDGTDAQSYNYLNLSNNARVRFYRYVNREDFQGNFFSSINVDFPGLSKTRYEYPTSNSSYKSSYSYLNFSASSVNRFYNENLKYYEITPALSFNASGYQNRNEFRYDNTANNYDTEYESSDLGFSASVNLRFGTGRIEPVEDLRQVVYILEELQKAGRLKGEISQETAIEVATRFSALKNRRFLDSRLRLIEEMTEIEKILMEMDLITMNDGLSFAIINDYWSMAGNPSRQAGRRFSAGLLPSYYYSVSKNLNSTIFFDPDSVSSSEGHLSNNGFNSTVNVLYECHKPLNLYWQRTVNTEAFIGIPGGGNKNLISDTENSYRMFLYGISGNYSLAYYPNSRTSYSGDAGITFQNGSGTEKRPAEEDVKYRYIRGYTGFSASYYFSPQLTVSGSFGLNYVNQYLTTTLYATSSYPKLNQFNGYLNVGMVYKIF